MISKTRNSHTNTLGTNTVMVEKTNFYPHKSIPRRNNTNLLKSGVGLKSVKTILGMNEKKELQVSTRIKPSEKQFSEKAYDSKKLSLSSLKKTLPQKPVVEEDILGWYYGKSFEVKTALFTEEPAEKLHSVHHSSH